MSAIYNKWEKDLADSDPNKENVLKDIRQLLDTIEELEDEIAYLEDDYKYELAVGVLEEEVYFLRELISPNSLDKIGYEIARELGEPFPSQWYLSNNRILELLSEYRKELVDA